MTETSVQISAGPNRTIETRLFSPENEDAPAVIVLAEAPGGLSEAESFARFLCANGHIACLPLLGIKDTGASGARFDLDQGLNELDKLIGHVRELPGANEKVAVAGFGAGGTLAYLSAARLSPDAVIIYQGKQIEEYLDEGRHIDCQTVFHVGIQDPDIAGEVDHKIHAALIGKFNIAIYKYETGRAFADEHDPVHYDKDAADKAHQRTLTHLSQLV